MNGLMILGTASDVGKSMICTALCRILADEGVNVAPFKSQNMSNFTAEIGEGLEISRAQFIQAEAAKTSASLYMNPIMLTLKPEMTSEVHILGERFGVVTGFDYRERYFERALTAINISLAQLAKNYETIIIEGAGSPAEVNLTARDVVNMRVAEIANVPAVLVADIDRGGAIAALVGTLQLLSEKHRRHIKGIILNRFHGDVSLFQEGVDFITSYTGIPVVGVIPYKANHGIEEEDVDRVVRPVPREVERYDAWATHVKKHLNWPLLQKIIQEGMDEEG